MNLNLGAATKRGQYQIDHFEGGIAAVSGDALVIRGELNTGGRSGPGGNRHHVVGFQRLVNRGQAVEAIGPGRADREAQVDLGMRSDLGGHIS